MQSPEYTLTDKDLTEIESELRAVVEEFSILAPTNDKTGKKVAVPGVRSAMRILDICASLRASYAQVEPKDPAEELAELERALVANQEFLVGNPKATTAVRESVRTGILKIEDRLAVLRSRLPEEVPAF